MADKGTPTKKWTDAEKTKFLVQAVKQMQAGGGKLNYKNFELEGRTPKALTHLWEKLSKDVTYSKQDGDADNAADDAGDPPASGSEPSTPVPKRTAAGRKRTAKAAGIGEDDDAGEVPATPSVKRQRKAPAAKAKAKGKATPATQAVDEDELEEAKPEAKPEQQNDLDPDEV